MSVPSRNPFRPPSPHGWHGIPGARHIPLADDPAFPVFIDTATEWKLAGVEMTDEIMQAVRKISELAVQRADERQKISQLTTERLASSTSSEPAAPGTFGDSKGGVIYYARRSRYVKIGTTVQLRDRMRSLMPDELMATEPGSYTLERQLHKRFADFRVDPTLEYFHLRGALVDHIEGVRNRCGTPPPNLTFSTFMNERP